MTIEEIKQKLIDAFPGSEIELINTSSMHVGHNARGYHLKTVIKYDGFKNATFLLLIVFIVFYQNSTLYLLYFCWALHFSMNDQ